MDERRDEIDAWLDAGVRPLLPPPGTFEAIQARARWRRTRRAAASLAAAVTLAAVAVLVIPQVVTALRTGGQPVASGGPGSRLRPTPSGQVPSSSPTAARPAVPAPAPPPLSVTFVGNLTGWVLGQATTPARCDLPAAPACLLLERTDSAGGRWRKVNPPQTHGPNGSTGVSQVRFLGTRNGWAFGPQLWATHDGGRTWAQVSTGGLRVTGLETRGHRVFAVWADCTGTGPAFAATCTRFSVYSSPAGRDQWAAVPGASGLTAPGGASSAMLVLNGTTAYLPSPGGTLVRGLLTGGAWQAATGAAPARLPCRPGAAQPDGQPSRALLATDASSDLALLCTGRPAGGRQPKTLYLSQDGGQSWRRSGHAPAAGTAMSVSGSLSGALMVATSQGIVTSADGGAHWRAATVTAAPPGGFVYVGMTTATQGVAVPADPSQHAIWFTFDGASTWGPSALR